MATYQFTNGTGLTIPDQATVNQAILALGIGAPISSVGITLNFATEPYLPDLDMLLVDPTGSVGYEFFSDIRNGIAGPLFLTISDQASDLLRNILDSVTISGAYRPADHGISVNPNESWPGRADIVLSAGPDGETSFADAFGGLSPNGVWTLYVADDAAVGTSSITSWSLTVVTDEARAITDVSPSLTVTEGDPATVLDGDITFNVEVDEFEDGKLVVSGLLAEDTVSIRDVGAGTGQIGFAGGIVSYEGVGIGTATGGSGADLVVTFDADADAEAIEALVENLGYRNTSDDPTAQRALQVTVTDAFGGETSIWRPGYTEADVNPFAAIDVGNNSQPTLGDVDSDGDLDLVVGNSNGGVQLFLQTELGEFELQVGNDNPLEGLLFASFAAPALGDLDSDGDLDLAVGSEGGGVGAYFQGDDGKFSLGTNPFSSIGAESYSLPALADIDGDGDVDLILTGQGIGILLYIQEDGDFTAAGNGENPFEDIESDGAASLSFGDLDGDGDLDMLLGDKAGALRTFFQNAAGEYVEQAGGDNLLDGVDVGDYAAPAIGDVDGDGHLDVVVGDQSGVLSLFRSQPEFGITVNVTAVNDYPIIAGDLDATVTEGGSVVLTPADLGFKDPDDDAAGVTFTVSNVVNGAIVVDGTPANTFTGQQILDGLVAFVHDGSQTTTAQFGVSVDDQESGPPYPVINRFDITVTPVDNLPSVPSDVDGQPGGSVTEDAAIGAAVGITASAFDPDSSLTYRLTDDAGGLFAIDASTGVVTVAKALDFETASSHTITVVATGSGVDGPASEFTIDVTDVNEAPANLVVTPTVAVPENVPITPGTLLATFSYDDDALGTEVRVLSGPDAALFSTAGNGIYWDAGLTPDFETQDEYRFTLTLADEDGLSTAAEVVVEVENRAVTNVVVAALGSIREDAAPNTVAARFTAFENGTAEPQAAFTLVDDAGGRFVLAGNELRLTQFGELDYETHQSHTITVRAGDGTGPAVEKSFVIQVIDVDESGPSESTDGPDEIPGTPGPEVLDGLRGDDTFFGSDGDDTISGGDGLDRVVYAGSREDFQQDLLPDGSILVTKPDGSTDRLSGIERIEFDDGAFVFDLDGEAAPFAYLLYQAAYDRVPDEAGLRFWTDILDQLADDNLGPEGAALAVAAYFLDADEFEANYGTNPSDEDFVEALYDNALGRAPDDAGADFWEDAIADGLSREAALVAFAMSIENVTNNAPNIEDGFWVG